MQKYKWVGHLYPDWFREPASPLERTWRWPLALKEAQEFIKQKLGLNIPNDYYVAKDGWLFLRTDYSRLLRQRGVLKVLFKFLGKLSKEKQNFENETIPQYRTLLFKWQKETELIKEKNVLQLWQWANGIMEVDVAYTIKIVYVGTYGFLFDFLLAGFYKRFVKDDPLGYHALLGGFPNRTYEMNLELFELSRMNKDEEAFKERFAKFLTEFGLEKSDWELVFPVLGEHPEAIMHLTDSYRAHPELNPRQRLEKARIKRQEKYEYALNNLKYSFITKPIFKWLVRWAQSYIPLRETRQHYIGAGTYFIRQALKSIAGKLGLQPEMVFYLERTEIETAANGTYSLEQLKKLSEERYDLRETQKQKPPYE